MITLILDGYNVIGSVPELNRQWDRNALAARGALISLCQSYRARRKDVARLYVVFDGLAAHAHVLESAQHGIVVRFTRGEEADAFIVNMVEAAMHRDQCVVVSEDKDLIHTVRALGARVLSVRAFYDNVQPSQRRQPARFASRDVDEKTMPSPGAARRITEELRTHLEQRAMRQAPPKSGHSRRRV